LVCGGPCGAGGDEKGQGVWDLGGDQSELFDPAVAFEPLQEFAGFDDILADWGELDVRRLLRGPASSQFVFEQQDESGGLCRRSMTCYFRIQMVRKRHDMVRSHWPAHGDHNAGA